MKITAGISRYGRWGYTGKIFDNVFLRVTHTARNARVETQNLASLRI